MTPNDLVKAAADAVVAYDPASMEPSRETALTYEHILDVLGEQVVVLLWGRYALVTMQEIIVTFLEDEVKQPTCEEE